MSEFPKLVITVVALLGGALVVFPASIVAAEIYRCEGNRYQAVPCAQHDAPVALRAISVVATQPSAVQALAPRQRPRRQARYSSGEAIVQQCRQLAAQRQALQAQMRRGYAAQAGAGLDQRARELHVQIQHQCRSVPQAQWLR